MSEQDDVRADLEAWTRWHGKPADRLGVWVNEMEILPLGYGVAWYDIASARAFCMRVPFNRIAGAFRAWYLEWRRPCEDDPILNAYIKGREDGQAGARRREHKANNAGYEAGIRHSAVLFKELKAEVAQLRGGHLVRVSMSDEPLTKEELLKTLIELQDYPDPENAHRDADLVLLRYINDPQVAAAFEAIDKWYA